MIQGQIVVKETGFPIQKLEVSLFRTATTKSSKNPKAPQKKFSEEKIGSAVTNEKGLFKLTLCDPKQAQMFTGQDKFFMVISAPYIIGGKEVKEAVLATLMDVLVNPDKTCPDGIVIMIETAMLNAAGIPAYCYSKETIDIESLLSDNSGINKKLDALKKNIDPKIEAKVNLLFQNFHPTRLPASVTKEPTYKLPTENVATLQAAITKRAQDRIVDHFKNVGGLKFTVSKSYLETLPQKGGKRKITLKSLIEEIRKNMGSVSLESTLNTAKKRQVELFIEKAINDAKNNKHA